MVGYAKSDKKNLQILSFISSLIIHLAIALTVVAVIVFKQGCGPENNYAHALHTIVICTL